MVDGSSGVLVRPFAQITAKVLRRLGGKYAELVEQMEQSFQPLSQIRMAIRESDKVRASEEGKARLRQACKEVGLTQEKLASQAIVSIDTVKRLIGTKNNPNGVGRQAVKNIAKVLNLKPTDIVDVKDWYPQRQFPPEFKQLIDEKTQLFCGREFVFSAIENFLQNNPNGYFTIIG